ncbi:MAG: O-antigen ligase family protein [Candidatus Izemoplasmatales bacterium]|nr:O-antigen ligase family protein [Candidatus Izemoplasmatales bacterium]
MIKQEFYKTTEYLVILSVLTYVFWSFGLERVGMPLFAILAIILLATNKNTIAVVPVFFNMMFMISQTEWSLEMIPIYLYMLPVLIIAGFVIHFVRFRPRFSKGKLFWPLLLLFMAMIFSMINADKIDLNYGFYLIIGLFYLLIYFFFNGSLKGDNLSYLIRLFLILGILVSLQVLTFYLKVDDAVDALSTKNLDLGWGISNFVATYLIIFISATFYYIKRDKLHVVWVLLAVFEIVMLFFTLSRGGISAFFITFFFLIYYLYHKSDEKNKLTASILVGIFALIISFFIAKDYYLAIYYRLTDGFFVDNGRFILWEQALNKFIANPLFGSGLFARVSGTYFGFYHNTFMHTLATLGIIGLASIIWQITIVLKMFFNNVTMQKMILLIALFGANIHGMVDNVYYMPQFMIIFFVIIAAVENHDYGILESETR